MAFLGIFGNYNKPGPGVNKDDPPKSAPVRFFEILLRKFGQLVQLNSLSDSLRSCCGADGFAFPVADPLYASASVG